ncbi:MAG: tetratricopeptide repeat protein [Nitrospirae bacterium]|nr:tetratricopeptide repeat protein [Nitrospirota bacterium]
MDTKKGQEKPLSPEIVKLSEKISKDPKSRLFVPLAEEYLKSGMTHEAMIVLTDGLKIHPNFHAARAILGKVYIENGQIAEARAEFEQVIKADPENLLAHRKLAKLYKEAGQTDKARISCKAVLSSNPKDAEMKLILDELDRVEALQRQKTQEQTTVSAESASVEMQVEQTSHPQPTPKSEPVMAEISAAPAEAPPAPVEAPPQETSPSLEEILGAPVSEAQATGKTAEVPKTGTVTSKEPSVEQVPVAPPPTEEITTEALADLYVKQGFYEKGIAIYRRLLSNDPANQALFKKLDETVDLARLLNEGPQLKTNTKPAAEAPPPAPTRPPEAPKEPPPPAAAPASDRDQQKIQKIQRLQSWLNSIKKGQG